MKKMVLTILDTRGIQRYIFNSNSLQHMIGASFLVHQASHDWPGELLRLLGKTNLGVDNRIIPELHIEDAQHALVAELINAGGGNTLIVFNEPEPVLALEFTRQLTRKILQEAPGLELAVTHLPFDWDAQPLREVFDAGMQQLARRKAHPVPAAPQLGLGVTADCQFTGLPAVGQQKEDGRRISAEIQAKLQASKPADERLHQVLPPIYRKNYQFMYNFDDFGDPGQAYLAVVHADVNNLGKRIASLTGQCATSREYIDTLRACSQTIEQSALEALRSVTLALTFTQPDEQGRPKIAGVVGIRDNCLPFRPLIFGGDDTTLVCDGRLGLSIARIYLNELKQHLLNDKQPIFARAGIAIVKAHYPFSLAYTMAEDLAQSARKFIVEELDKEGYATALDWHITSTGMVSELKGIREQEYWLPFPGSPHGGRLTMRPVHLGGFTDWRSWDTLMDFYAAFTDRRNWPRSKVMMLRERVRSGPQAVREFLTAYGSLELPAVAGSPESARTGFNGNTCTCLDAIEILDFYTNLEGSKS